MKFANVIGALESGRTIVGGDSYLYKLIEGRLKYRSKCDGKWMETANDLAWFLRQTWEVVEEPAKAPKMPRSEGSHDGVNWIEIPEGDCDIIGVYRYFRRTNVTGESWGREHARLRTEVARLTRELEEARERNRKCQAATSFTQHCELIMGHPGMHRRSGVQW